MKTAVVIASSQSLRIIVALAFLIAFTSVLADDLTGVKRFICAPAQVNICYEDGSCNSAMPWDVNVQRFLEIDLKQKSIATTEASGENRVSPTKSIGEDVDAVFLQRVYG